jgi:hypothetical protein
VRRHSGYWIDFTHRTTEVARNRRQAGTDLERELQETENRMLAWIAERIPNLQENLIALITHQKGKWARATEEQKEVWRTRKLESFAKNPPNTRLATVPASVESRWLPQDHNVCQICWKNCATIRFRHGDESKKHMKDCHKVGWRNVKDAWCTMFSIAMGVTIIGKGERTRQGVDSIELSNSFLACPRHKCRWNHNHGLDHHKHYEKGHEEKGTPEMGNCRTFIDLLRRNPGATVGVFWGRRRDSCAHAVSLRRKKRR